MTWCTLTVQASVDLDQTTGGTMMLTDPPQLRSMATNVAVALLDVPGINAIDDVDLRETPDCGPPVEITCSMTPQEEAHWRYTLEYMTNYGYNARKGMVGSTFGMDVPDEVSWLREEARYKCHLANAEKRRAATFIITGSDDI